MKSFLSFASSGNRFDSFDDLGLSGGEEVDVDVADGTLVNDGVDKELVGVRLGMDGGGREGGVDCGRLPEADKSGTLCC